MAREATLLKNPYNLAIERDFGGDRIVRPKRRTGRE
jgi:hypothetical protein